MGRRIPSFDKIEKIAIALKISPGQLFQEESLEDRKKQKIDTKEYLGKMPAHVRKEIISRLVNQLKEDAVASLDPEEY